MARTRARPGRSSDLAEAPASSTTRPGRAVELGVEPDLLGLGRERDAVARLLVGRDADVADDAPSSKSLVSPCEAVGVCHRAPCRMARSGPPRPGAGRRIPVCARWRFHRPTPAIDVTGPSGRPPARASSATLGPTLDGTRYQYRCQRAPIGMWVASPDSGPGTPSATP